MAFPLRPKEPRNAYAALAVAAVAILLFLLTRGSAFSPKTGAGLVFGALAALVFVFEMLYPFRRPRARPLKKARHWLQAHVYLGGLAVLFVLLHTAFSLPHGWPGWMLLLLSLWVAGGGMLGVLLQKWIPASLADGLRVEALYEEIPGLVQRLRDDADALVDGRSDTLQDFYRLQLRPSLSQVNPSWAYLFDVRAGRERALEPLRQIAPFVDAEEQPIVEDLVAIHTQKLELDAQYRMQSILRGWLGASAHALLGGVLLGLLTVHILSWVLY